MEEKLKEMSFIGLHKFIFDTIIKNKIKKDSKVLILGSGVGAFDQRMLKSGYKNIYSVDYFTEHKLKDKVNFMKADLNDPNFSQVIENNFNSKFDLVIAIEIIEHTNSIYNYLENSKKLLEKNGTLLISTPNPHSFLARADTLITGYPTFYVAKPGIGDHISPVYDNVLEHFADSLKLKITKKSYFGTFRAYFKTYEKNSLRSYIYLFVLGFLYLILNPFMVANRKISKGTNVIYILKIK